MHNVATIIVTEIFCTNVPALIRAGVFYEQFPGSNVCINIFYTPRQADLKTTGYENVALLSAKETIQEGNS